MKKLIIILTALTSVLIMSGCKDTGSSVEDNVVYVTVYPMQYLVEAIAGDKVIVKRVPRSSGHVVSIDWFPKEIIDMIESDLLFYIHGGLDNYIEDTKDSTLKGGDVTFVDMSKYISYNQVCFSHEHDDETTTLVTGCDAGELSDDPHFWLDPVKMLEAANVVKEKLIIEFPENQELFNNNFIELSASLEKLHEDYTLMSNLVTKPIMTTTMLFTYYHERYNIEIHPISTSLHTTQDIATDFIEFTNEALENDLDYIIFEKNANSPTGDKILEEINKTKPEASKLYLHGLGNLTREEFEEGKNYIIIMYDNLETLNSATK